MILSNAEGPFCTHLFFLRDSDYLSYFYCLTTNRPTLMLLIFLLSESEEVSQLNPILFLPRVSTRGETHFSPLMLIKDSFLGKNMRLRVINCTRLDPGSGSLPSRGMSTFFKNTF